MDNGMTPSPDRKKVPLLFVIALILIAGIVLVIAIFAAGVFPISPFQVKTPTLSVISLTPDRGAAGTAVPVTIGGMNFTYGQGPSVWLEKTGAGKIPATDVVVISPTQIKSTFLLPESTSAGLWDLTVTLPDGQFGSKTGAFTVANDVSPLIWDWSRDGWGDWQHAASTTDANGPVGINTGSWSEYGPSIVNGHGVYGVNIVDPHSRVRTESHVSKIFTAPSGTVWNTLTFTGELSPTALLTKGRWMAVDVNGIRVFYANATQTPPGNGQQFNITQPFTPAVTVMVTISSGQDLTWDTSSYTMQYNSLTLRWNPV